MGFDGERKADEVSGKGLKTPPNEEEKDGDHENEEKIHRTPSESSICANEDEDDDDLAKKIDLGPQVTLKEQFEKDKVLPLPSSPLFVFLHYRINKSVPLMCSAFGNHY